MTNEWLDLLHNAARSLDEESMQLTDIAYAAKRVGNDKLGDEIQNIANRLQKIEKNIMTATSLKTSEDVKDAMDTSSALLLTALAASPKKKAKP